MEISAFSNQLGYTFNDENLLLEALRHSSFVNEQPEPDLKHNERLEFLGDAVLSLAIGRLLMQRYPDMREGDLSRIRAGLVNESRLAKIARYIHLGDYIQLGKGEIQTDGRSKTSILANTLEAVFAAVFLDDGFETACEIICRHFCALIESALSILSDDDHKSQLQEWIQIKQGTIPRYTVINESGPDHDKLFCVELRVGNLLTQGTGKSKKTAEQNAAKIALEILKDSTAN